MKIRSHKEAGFSAVEGLAVIVIVALIGAAGFYVMKNRTTSTETESASVAAKRTTVEASKVGTTSGVDQLTSLDEKSEAAADAKYETTEQQTASSDTTALKSIGGAYDESSF